MTYDLLFVDAGFRETSLHKLNVVNGDYVRFQRIDGNGVEQAMQLCELLIKERPDKVIFDKTSVGNHLYEVFRNIAKDRYTSLMTVDSFGLVIYN